MAVTKSFRKIIQLPDSPLSFHEGVWSVKDRKLLWDQFGSQIFDDSLDAIQMIAIDVLSEDDPQFQLDSDDRFAASVHGKVLSHSRQIREGLAETLALLACYPEALKNCSLRKPECTAALAIRNVLDGANWVRWASLDRLLPTLAEASPEEFLGAVENALQSDPCPFDELFAQEKGRGVAGSTYISGLLWALEGLAWSELHFVRAMLVLAGLADRDPGGSWSNRPSASMTMILLPWFPQTTAGIEKRQAAIETIHREYPQVAWKLLLSLMPGLSRTSTPTHAPKWRSYKPGDWEDGTTRGEYHKHVAAYGDLLLKHCLNDLALIPELAKRLDNLPSNARDQLLRVLETDDFKEAPETVRTRTWETLSSIVRKHERGKDADWAFPNDILKHVNTVVERIKPTDPLNQYRYLFASDEHSLYKENGNWSEQREQLEIERKQAVQSIVDIHDLKGVMDFAKSVEEPRLVGRGLGLLSLSEYDKDILPTTLMDSSNAAQEFVAGFVFGRWLEDNWDWVDSVDRSDWTREEAAHFFRLLPFIPETWKRVGADLGEHENLYWASVSVMPYDRDCDTDLAARQLLKHNRPKASLRCIAARRDDEAVFDSDLTINALLKALDSDEPSYTTDTYELVELITALQNRDDLNQADMLKVEWGYLPLLDEFSGGSPVLLESQMASNPEVFCHILSLVYRSSNESSTKKSVSDHERFMANNAYQLLHDWSTPPGSKTDDRFSVEEFSTWLNKVIDLTTDSGHLDIALQQVGHVLIHTPQGENGLPLLRGIAEIVNRPNMEQIRTGYSLALFNSRGVHIVNPTGEPEIKLAESYQKQANALEHAGYVRLAVTLKELAEQYRLEAKRLQNRESRTTD